MPLLEFEGCRERIWRARTHRKAFAQMWVEFCEDDPYSTIVEIDDNGAGSIRVVPSYDTLPSVFSLQLGELLYQLRAALDASVYACALRETGQDPPPDHDNLEFPIRSTPAKFKDACWKIRPLSDERRRIIESVQPYNARQLAPDDMVNDRNRALSMLNDWARKDRHRRLHLVGSWGSNASPKLSIPRGVQLENFIVRGNGFLEDESEIATFRLNGYVKGVTKVHANAYVTIDIAVNESPPPCADTDTLGNRVLAMIEGVEFVVSSLERTFQRP